MTDSSKAQAAETRDQKIDRLLENSGHGTRREDIEAAFAEGARSAPAVAPSLPDPPPRPNIFWDAEDGIKDGGAIADDVGELLARKASLGLINEGDELIVGRAIRQPEIKVRVTEIDNAGAVQHELVRQRARWILEWPRDDGRFDRYVCEFIDGKPVHFLSGDPIQPTDEQRPAFERLERRMRQYAHANPGTILGAPV